MSKAERPQRFKQNFPAELIKELDAYAVHQIIEKDTVLLKEGDYIKYIPVVLNGLIKVFSHYNDKEILLYYINNEESCVMSFVANLHNKKSHIYAIAEETTELLLLPSHKVTEWTGKYAAFNHLYFGQFNQRYIDLVGTINKLLFDKLDKRLMDYLNEKSALTGRNPLKLSHQHIADELGTAREVISRILKKLEHKNILEQTKEGIKLLER